MIPLFIVLGFLIKLNDKGPVFFRHMRVGQGGKLFILYKFRSMKIATGSENGQFEPGNNSRVTTIGKYLRRTKLDELPQMINVLKGEMSIVGPRPEVAKWVEVYPERWERVLTVKPGITDESSLLFLNEEALLFESDDPEQTYKEIILPKKLDLYEAYVDNNSFSGDLQILFRTIFRVIFQ